MKQTMSDPEASGSGFVTNFKRMKRKVLNKLMDGFDGKLTSSKWAKIARCSKDSAVRGIDDLIEKGILQKGISFKNTLYFCKDY